MAEEFFTSFEEFITLYRGIETVTIDQDGVLTAEWVDGQTRQIGPVTGYYYALQHGFTGSFEDWVQLIEDSADNAVDAKLWAVGTTESSAGTPGPNNNAKKYSELAADSATAASGSASDASDSAALAHDWAVKSSGGTPSATNNAQYWAEQAASSASDASIDAATATGAVDSIQDYYNETVKPAFDDITDKYPTIIEDYEKIAGEGDYANNGLTERAETAAATAEAWATKTTGGTPSATNNAQYYSEQASATASAVNTQYQAIAGENGYAANAEKYSEWSEAWAQFTKNGSPILDPNHASGAYQKNSKYWADQASTSATNAASSATSVAGVLSDVNAAVNSISSNIATFNERYSNVSNWYTQMSDANTGLVIRAENAAQNAQEWVTGTRGGTPSSTNNAQYWAAQSQDSYTLASIAADDASDSASEAQGYAAAAQDSVESIMSPSVNVQYNAVDAPDTIPTVWYDYAPTTKGKYICAKVVLTWAGSNQATYYTYSYIGTDGASAVTSVNGMTGAVVIPSITTEEIEALFT